MTISARFRYQTAHRPPFRELMKATMLAVAFLFWAANQLWPDLRQATLFNDIAIALFVLDVFLVMIGWPATSPDESFGETYVAPGESPVSQPGGREETGQ
jgi:cytochrome c oxidase assembly factor CtaG